MRKKEEVFLLFRFMADEDGSNSQTYQVVFFFDYNGLIDYSEYRSCPFINDMSDPTSTLSFQTKEHLIEFSECFIQTNSYQQIYLLSANDFNIGIESCHELGAFREIFKKYGSRIENNSKPSRSIFGNIF